MNRIALSFGILTLTACGVQNNSKTAGLDTRTAEERFTREDSKIAGHYKLVSCTGDEEVLFRIHDRPNSTYKVATATSEVQLSTDEVASAAFAFALPEFESQLPITLHYDILRALPKSISWTDCMEFTSAGCILEVNTVEKGNYNADKSEYIHTSHSVDVQTSGQVQTATEVNSFKQSGDSLIFTTSTKWTGKHNVDHKASCVFKPR